jgi:hypothetical protein
MPGGTAEVAASKRRRERSATEDQNLPGPQLHKPLFSRKGATIANCDFTVSGSAGLALRSSVMEMIGNRMQMTHSKASKAIADRRAPAGVIRGAAQNSSSVAAIPAQTILRISSKVVRLNVLV